MEYNKLVRDKIPEIIEKDGEKPITRTVEGKELEEYLRQKMREEVDEFLEDPSIKEANDVDEVMRAILILKGVDVSRLEEERQKRAAERGGFEKGIILERTEGK